MTGTPQTREEMEARAQALGLQYPANIKDATLAKKIAEAEATFSAAIGAYRFNNAAAALYQ